MAEDCELGRPTRRERSISTSYEGNGRKRWRRQIVLKMPSSRGVHAHDQTFALAAGDVAHARRIAPARFDGVGKRSVVMQATIAERSVIIVLLDANGTSARSLDAFRVKHWLEGVEPAVATKHRQKRRM